MSRYHVSEKNEVMIELHPHPVVQAEFKAEYLPAHNPRVPSSNTPPSTGSPRPVSVDPIAGPGPDPEEFAPSPVRLRAPVAATPPLPRPHNVTAAAAAVASRPSDVTAAAVASRPIGVSPAASAPRPIAAASPPVEEVVLLPRGEAGRLLDGLTAASPVPPPPALASPVAAPLERALPAASLSRSSLVSALASLATGVDRLTMRDMAGQAVVASTLQQAATWKWDGGDMHATLLLPEVNQIVRGEASLVAMGRACRLGGFGRIRRAVAHSGEGQRLSAKGLRLTDGILADEAAKKTPKTKYTPPKHAFHEIALLAAPFTQLSVRGVMRFKHHLYVLSDWLPHSLDSLQAHLGLPACHQAYPGMVGRIDTERQNLSLVLETMAQIGQQLSRLHENNWVHRDIKPANILLADARKLSLVLGDFGLAVHMPNGIGLAYGVSGTPGYLSPEMVTERGYTFSTDSFSLGIMLANQLAGTRIFSRLNGLSRTARQLMMVDHAKALTLWHDNTFGGYAHPIPAALRNHVRYLGLAYEEAQDADPELASYIFGSVLNPEPLLRAAPAAIAAYGAQRLGKMPELQLHSQQMMDSLNANDVDAQRSRREFSLLETLHRDAAALFS